MITFLLSSITGRKSYKCLSPILFYCFFNLVSSCAILISVATPKLRLKCWIIHCPWDLGQEHDICLVQPLSHLTAILPAGMRAWFRARGWNDYKSDIVWLWHAPTCVIQSQFWRAKIPWQTFSCLLIFMRSMVMVQLLLIHVCWVCLSYKWTLRAQSIIISTKHLLAVPLLLWSL